jgi:uncharacterized protein YacL
MRHQRAEHQRPGQRREARLLAGEELAVQIVREGKEPGQGVGFLDDAP